MESLLILLVVVIVLTLVFDFLNGFHDAANAIATVVATRVLKPRNAVMYGAVLNLAGAMMGTEVAATIGKGLVEVASVSLDTILCTIIAAIAWNIITWYKGLPVSSSHGLIGSLLGATYFSAGNDSIMWNTVVAKVVTPMVTSPFIGFGLGFFVMWLLTWMVYKIHLGTIQKVFSKMQILSAGFMALEHGRNDAQKSMGIIALALLIYAPQADFVVPLWVKITCALMMGAGTLFGGWRIIRTMGSKMVAIQPIHGFAAETTGALVITGASHFGIPVSTTQVISSSIMGVGVTRGMYAMRWDVVARIMTAWVLTLPLTFGFAGGLMWLYRLISS